MTTYIIDQLPFEGPAWVIQPKGKASVIPQLPLGGAKSHQEGECPVVVGQEARQWGSLRTS